MTWLTIGGCLLISFIYAGIEAGLLSLNRARLRGRVRAGERAAIRLDLLLSHPERLLATVLLVTNFFDVAALILTTDSLIQKFGSPRGYFITLIVLLPLYLIGVQLLPKSLFRRFPYRSLAALAGVLEATSWALSPVLRLGGMLARALAWKKEIASHNVFVAREEVKLLAAEGERVGALSPAERGMIHTVVDFRAVRASEVMRPLPQTFAAGSETRVADLLAFANTHRLECVPVVAAQDNRRLLALLDVFTLLLERDSQRPATAYLRRPPVSVQPGDRAYAIIRRLRTARSSFAAVVEAGQPVGMVRGRDLINRFVRGAAD